MQNFAKIYIFLPPFLLALSTACGSLWMHKDTYGSWIQVFRDFFFNYFTFFAYNCVL